MVTTYNDTLLPALDRHAPTITKTITKRPTLTVPSWFNQEVKSAKKERRRAERKWRKTRLHSDFLDFKTKKNQVTYSIKRARIDYYSTVIQKNEADQRKLFRSAKSLFEQEADLTFQGYHDNRTLANDIGKFFVQKVEHIRNELDTTNAHSSPAVEKPSLCSTQLSSFTSLTEEDIKRLIGKSSKKSCSLDPMPTPLVVECLDVLLPVVSRMINPSLQTGSFPDTWKHADIRPRLKKPYSEATFTNLCPISNLQSASKLTERAVFLRLHDFLSTHNLYLSVQSSYRQHHSTKTALLKVKNDILLNMNQQQVTLLVLLDLSTAFDTVNHKILLDRLHTDFGISGQVHSWFESYLRDRSQSISVNDGTSMNFQMKYGVPQGSCLGPLLFVIYASKLFEIIERHLPDVHTYADDTQLYIYFNAASSI